MMVAWSSLRAWALWAGHRRGAGTWGFLCFDEEGPIFDSLQLTRKGEGANVKASGWARCSFACLLFLTFLACMAAPITYLIAFEMGHIFGVLCRLEPRATLWGCAPIAMFRMIIVIHMTAEVVAAMKPRTGTDEDTTGKPFRTIVAGRSAAIRGSVIVPIGAFRGDSNVNADLSLQFGSGHREADGSDTASARYLSLFIRSPRNRNGSRPLPIRGSSSDATMSVLICTQMQNPCRNFPDDDRRLRSNHRRAPRK